MGLSKLHICNQALLKIGEQILVSLDDGSGSAELCTTFFDQALEEMLREYPWNCACKRAQLALRTEPPLFGYDYSYELPVDYIRLLQVYDLTGHYRQEIRWTVERGQLLTDLEGVYIKYIALVEDTTILDSLATSALVCKLAMKMAFARTDSKTLVQSILEEYEGLILPRARSIDTHENKENQENNDFGSWVRARHGN